MIYALDHMQLAMPVGQEALARQFYGEVLGLREVPKPPELAKRGVVWFESDTSAVKVHLGVKTDFRPARKAHPAFLVRDLEQMLAVCRAQGCEVKDDEPPLTGYRRVHVFDPFGNRIELMQAL